MKVHVFVATTQGLVAIQNIRPIDDADISSIVSVNGTSTIANISTAYHHFVKKGAGIIQQDFGACSYRVNISDRIDHGNSWQLAFYIAHAVEQQGVLGDGQVELGDYIICATGEVNTSSRKIQAVAQVPLKQSIAQQMIEQWKNQGVDYLFLLPKANENDIKSEIKAQAVETLLQALSYLPTQITQGIKTQQNKKQTADSAHINSTLEDGFTPSSIGKYNIIKELGSGGFGAVYLAKDPKLDVLVAIKVFTVKDEKVARQATSSSQDASSVLRQRFENEARLLRELSSNDFIIEMYEFDELTDGTPYYVMPYLPKSLVDEMGKDAFSQGALSGLSTDKHPRRISTSKAIVYLKQLSEALAAVHQKGLVHRDIKPANVLLNAKGKVQLCDFGIAKLPDTEHSQTSFAMGSRHYMSPEQRESAKHVQASSDIYSLGVLAYRMFTGQLPEGRYADPINFAPEMGQTLNQLILSSLDLDPDKRPSNAEDFLLLLLKSLQKSAIESEDHSKTWVNEAEQSKSAGIKKELNPLIDRITQILLAEGEIPDLAKVHVETLAYTLGVNNDELKTLIARIEQQYAQQLQPLQNWLAMAEVHARESKGYLSEYAKAAIISASLTLGKSQAFILDKLTTIENKYRNVAVNVQDSASGNEKTTIPKQSYNQPSVDKPEQSKSNKLVIVLSLVSFSLLIFLFVNFWQTKPLEEEVAQEEQKELTGAGLIQVNKQPILDVGIKEENQSDKTQTETQTQTQKDLIPKDQRLLQNEDIKRLEASKVSLNITTLPSDSEIELLGTEYIYHQGLKLQPNKYQVKVSHAEYYSETQTIDLTKDNNQLNYILKRIAPEDITYTVGQTEFTLKGIPAGRYKMGCENISNVCQETQLPQHQVDIAEFRIMSTEVTFALWNECVKATGCLYQPDNAGWSNSERPVIKVSYDDINKEFIPWLNQKLKQNFSLPSEAQWEYAARAKSPLLDSSLPSSHYSWGNEIKCSQANFGYYGNVCGKNHATTPVKSFSSNAFGLYDMHGNVSEWVDDCWHESYHGAPDNGKAWLSSSCKQRVVRGGSWVDNAQQLTSASRDKFEASARNYIFGFRLVQNN